MRIRFEREGTKVTALTVSDPDLIVRGRKSRPDKPCNGWAQADSLRPFYRTVRPAL